MIHPSSAGDIHRAIVAFADSGKSFAVAVVLKDEGSTPRKAATKALIESDGSIHGTVGGGRVEAEIQRLAVEAIRSGRPAVADFALEGGCTGDNQPLCGGAMRILIDPTAAAHRAAYAQAVEAERLRQRGVLLTSVRTCAFGGQAPQQCGAHAVGQAGPVSEVTVRWIPEDAPSSLKLRRTSPWASKNAPPAGRGVRRGGVGFPGIRAIRAALRRQTPELFVRDLSPRRKLPFEPEPQSGRLSRTNGGGPSGVGRAQPAFAEASAFTEAKAGKVEVLVEPVVPPPLLVIAGGGHIGQALALQADLVGFAVTVIDDRAEFTDPALYPAGVVTRCGDIAGELGRFPIAGDTFIAIVTRGHQQDRAALAACVRKPAAYIGMIGSRRKVALIRKDLLESGAAAAEEFDRVYTPIGLDIGAETVPEIAASIVGQLIAAYRKGRAPRFPAR